jgi:hypothetical protein
MPNLFVPTHPNPPQPNPHAHNTIPMSFSKKKKKKFSFLKLKPVPLRQLNFSGDGGHQLLTTTSNQSPKLYTKMLGSEVVRRK